MNPADLELRDIHLPDPISWWPPAIGWWIVAAILLAAIVIPILYRRYTTANQRTPLFLARAELERVRSLWLEQRDFQVLLTDLSIWLRRASMSFSSRRQAASLTGQDWQQFLDDVAGEPIFTADAGQFILDAPYRTPGHTAGVDLPDGEQLLEICERWLGAASQASKQGLTT
jgi:hypothetical protein